MPLTGSKFDQIGPLARCVADLLLFDTALTGESGPMTTASLKGVRTLHSLSGFLEEQGTGMNFEQMLEQASEEIQAVIKGFALPPNRPSQEVYESMLV
jgi:Asp-tRNA(Asn)/Glu-tRNA(Gln) amidotransferase A subunit family amidase